MTREFPWEKYLDLAKGFWSECFRGASVNVGEALKNARLMLEQELGVGKFTSKDVVQVAIAIMNENQRMTEQGSEA
jgi:hypothetical protein